MAGTALAIDGGTPLVTEEIPLVGYGADLIGEAEEQAVLDALRTRRLCRITNTFEDSYTNRFEEEVRARTGAPYFHAVNSCASALYTAMAALEIGPGDEVLVSGAGWFSVANAAIALGAVPVPVEFDESLSIDCDDLSARITARTRAVVVVHWRGLPADMDRVMAIARSRGISVIEDVAQSFGGSYRGRALGTIGDIGCFSFNMHKVITAGEGGGIAVRDPELYKRVVSIAGMYNFWVHHVPDPTAGSMPSLPMQNFRMPELCGALAWVQVQRLDEIIGGLRARCAELLDGLERIGGVELAPRHDPDGECGYTVPLLFPDAHLAQRFCDALRAEGVPTVSTLAHAFSGGEARGTAALVLSEGLDPAESGAMALADAWRPLVERRSFSPGLDPWRSDPDAPAPTEDVVPLSRARLGRVATLKLNTHFRPRHVELVVAATEKVMRAIAP